MNLTQTVFLSIVFSSWLTGCVYKEPHFTSKHYLPSMLKEAAVLQPYVEQGFVERGNIVDINDSLCYEFAAILNDQLPTYLGTSERVWYPELSPVAQREMAYFMRDLPKGKSRFTMPEQARSELQDKGIRFAIVFLAKGYSLSNQIFKGRQIAGGVVNFGLFAVMANSNSTSSPIMSTTRRSIGYGIPSVPAGVQHVSQLEMAIVDVQEQKLVKYQANSQFLSPVHPFTIRQHLTTFFMTDKRISDEEK